MGDIEESEGEHVNRRGQRLHTYAYVPQKVRCVLFYHHGFGEYSGRAGMPEVFRSWAQKGIAVHTYDCHSHGRSEPKGIDDRFLIWDFNHVVDDLSDFTKKVRKDYSSTMPMFLGGHSMGSLASIHVALREQAAWDGLVLGTATVDVEWNWTLRLQASVGSLLAMLIPRAQIVPSPPANVTVDNAQEATVIARDPLLMEGYVRARTANEMLRGFAHVQQFGHLLWLPIYCHHGTADRLANINAVRNLLGRCASSDITFYEVEGGAHELYVGVESKLVTGYVVEWIEAQLNRDVASEASGKALKKSGSMISVSGNPFEWRPVGGSPCGSVYGSSPRGSSPFDSPRKAGNPPGPFKEDLSLWQEQCA